jgi:branched-chain amino acid transport system substrate-binding protein
MFDCDAFVSGLLAMNFSVPGSVLCLLLAGLPVSALAADNGVSADKIVFGQAAVFEGAAASLGIGMREGIQAAFAEVNKTGGVKGRKLELVARDDGYEPKKSIEVTRTLLENDKVFALVGPVGTPTAAAALPIATEQGVPFVGPFTGVEFLRNPHKRNVANVRASYFQETETMVERLTKDLGLTRIAIFYQDDAFGRAGLAGVQKALEKRKMSLAAEGTYERNTTAIKRALLDIRRGNPEAVVMVGAYKPSAEFIKLARRLDMNAVFINISFVGSDALAKELGRDGAGVIVTQVVPFPGDAEIPLVARYQAALKAHDAKAQPGFVSLEGYMVGRLVAAALERIPGEPSREGLLDAIAKGGAFDLAGAKLTYGANDNQGMDEVFLTVIAADGTFKAVTKLTRAAAEAPKPPANANTDDPVQTFSIGPRATRK